MNEKKVYATTEFWAGVLAPAAIVAILSPAILVRALVIMLLWRWYFAPLTFVPLPFANAVGVQIIAYVLLGDRYNSSDDRSVWTRWGASLFGPLVLLVVGWALSFVL